MLRPQVIFHLPGNHALARKFGHIIILGERPATCNMRVIGGQEPEGQVT
jgi:hypothetical protein